MAVLGIKKWGSKWVVKKCGGLVADADCLKKVNDFFLFRLCPNKSTDHHAPLSLKPPLANDFPNLPTLF